MKPIAIYNYKGGVGKSTIAANLAETAAGHQPTCVVDCDSQCTTSFYMLGIPQAVTAMKNHNTIRHLMDWIGTTETIARAPHKLLTQPANWQSKLICGDMTLTEVEMQLVLQGIGQAQRIWQALYRLNEDDFGHWPIIDCSPSYSFFTIAATFCAAGGIFIPVTTEEDSLYGITLTARAIHKVVEYTNASAQKRGICCKIRGIICNRVTQNKQAPLLAALKHTVDGARRAFPDSFEPNFKILNTLLPEDPQIASTRAERKSLKSYAPTADISAQLKDIDKRLEGLSPDQIIALKSELTAIHQELTQVTAYQKGIYQWLVAIGDKVGIKPAEETDQTAT
jgi:cellulose biosynthesis protein BcsQ